MQGRVIAKELRAHVPFTTLGSLTGVAIMFFLLKADISETIAERLFRILHPSHVLLSALATTAMFRRHGGRGVWRILWVGYLGSVGVATLSDCIIPFIGETLLNLPRPRLHFGFIDDWWLVNPLALLGIGLGAWRPRTRAPHALHVLVSTWASLFHFMMAMQGIPPFFILVSIAAFLFLAVWIPCCTSDIVFPLLFTRNGAQHVEGTERHEH